MNDEMVLYHYGVKGMKWGRRKQRVTNGTRKKRNYKKIAKQVGRTALASALLGSAAGALAIGASEGTVLAAQGVRVAVSAGKQATKKILKNSGALNYSSIKNKSKVVAGYVRNKRAGVVFL